MEIDKDTWNWMVEMAEQAPDLGCCEEEFGVAALVERICEMGREEEE